ncbi:MAG: efflux RND transporter permease subunit [Gemmatimonadetes bacterium]|nr:efflux RND transporter permease subunit [Gemmatimonadota bacterium]
MSLPGLSIRRPIAVAMLFVAVAFLGVISFTRLPVDLLPDIAYPKLVIYTGNPETGPAEIERFITEPIEAAVGRVPGIETVESVSREGVSMIVLRFAWGTDMDFAALNVRESLDGLRGSLPERAQRPVVLRTDPRSEPIMAISVAADADLWSLKDLTESVFRRRLEQIDGVAQAALTGGLEREIHVDVDGQLLESYGITIDQIATALAAANTSAQSGTIRQGRFRYALRTLGELQSVDQIGGIVITQTGSGSGAPRGRVLLRDVATIEDGFRERESIARYNGREAVGLLIFKESGANTVRVAETVEEVLAQLRSEHPEVNADVAMSQAGFVSGAISNLIQEMVFGAILAFLVLMLFLRDPRYPFAISLAIPISLVATFGLFHLFGVSLNIMSLGGLALGIGMLVDNSIVVIENIFRNREKGTGAVVAAAVGTEEVQRAITAATLTTIAVFGPIIYVEGVAGELFASLSFAVAFSLFASLAVAVMLLPTMAARWADDKPGTVRRPGPIARSFARPMDAFDRQWDRFADWYQMTLASALRHRRRVLVGCVLLLAATIPIALGLPRSVLPDVDQGEFRARMELPRGTPLDQTADRVTQLEQFLAEDEAVDVVFSRIGRQAAVVGMDEEHSGLNTALLEVRLHSGQRTRDVLERLRPKLAALPAGSITLETGHATALGKLLGAGEADLAVRVRGQDMDSAMAYAALVARQLQAVPEVTNVRVGVELGQPEYVVEIDRERAAAFGIDPSAVVTVIENAMRGRAAANPFVAFDRKVPILVRLPEEDRRSLATLDRLSVQNVPVRELIHVREAVGPVEVQRLDQTRVVPVYADATGRDVDGAVRAVEAALAGTPPPPPMRFDIGGENEEMRRSFRELLFAFLLAVLLVYMILAAEFESLVQPFTILLSVPLGLIGAFIALWLFGGGLNTVSLIGIVILVGIVDNNAVVMIDFINQRKAEGAALRDAILDAGRARLRPIVMTTITTMLAILPMMFGIGAGAGLQAPLAIAVFGGLFTATALTLLVIPVVYELIEDTQARVRGRADTPRVAVRPAPAQSLLDHNLAGTGRVGGD